MNIAFVKILLAFASGIIISYGFTNVIFSLWSCIICTAIFTCLVIINLLYRRLKAYQFKAFTGMLFYSCMFGLGCLCCILHKQPLTIDFKYDKNPKYIRLRINDEPQIKSGILRFKAVVTRSISASVVRPASGNLMVAIRIDSLKPVLLSYGDELIIPASYHEIARPYNPSEFDYKSWLAAQNIYHQAYLKQHQLVKIDSNKGNPVIAFALRLRAKQVAYYRKLVKNDDAFSVAATLILGYRADLSQNTLDIYSKTGTIHALSVSGMHVGLIYLILNLALQFLNRGRLLKVLKVVIMVLLIWFYALLTGCAPSVLRSAIMLSAFIIAKSFSRSTNSYNIIAFAAFSLLVYDPFLIWDVGFQLSFLAVLGLIYLQPKIQNWWYIENNWLNKLWGLIAMSLAAQFITYPLSVYYFHQFPVYFLLSNLFITIPCALLMYLGIILLVLRLDFLAPAFEWLIHFTNDGLNWIANAPFSSLSAIWLSKTELLLLCAALTLLVLALSQLKKSLLFAGLVCFLIFQLLLSLDKIAAKQQKKIIVFNLRKNYAVAFISAQRAVVFSDLTADVKSFKYFIQPALDKHKVSEIYCINGEKDTVMAHFSLKNDEIAFYNYQIGKADLRNHRLFKAALEFEVD